MTISEQAGQHRTYKQSCAQWLTQTDVMPASIRLFQGIGRVRTAESTGFRIGVGGSELALIDLKANPGLSRTRAFVAYLAARLGDKKRAEDEIMQALQVSPGDNKIVRRAVLTYEALGQRDRALAVLGTYACEVPRPEGESDEGTIFKNRYWRIKADGPARV